MVPDFEWQGGADAAAYLPDPHGGEETCAVHTTLRHDSSCCTRTASPLEVDWAAAVPDAGARTATATTGTHPGSSRVPRRTLPTYRVCIPGDAPVRTAVHAQLAHVSGSDPGLVAAVAHTAAQIRRNHPLNAARDGFVPLFTREFLWMGGGAGTTPRAVCVLEMHAPPAGALADPGRLVHVVGGRPLQWPTALLGPGLGAAALHPGGLPAPVAAPLPAPPPASSLPRPPTGLPPPE